MALGLLLGCGTSRPPPCPNCGALVDVPVVASDTSDAGISDVPAAQDAPTSPDIPAAQDVPSTDGPDVADVPDASRDDVTDASADIAEDVPLDVPQDPPVTRTRTDLGTRGIVASLPCGDVLRNLDVEVTPRTVPANSFELRVRNASATETISVWYNATLNADWNIESLASDLAPGMSVTMSFWRVSGSPAWYVLGIARSQHYYVNGSGVFVELPCGRAARNATQEFRRTITP